VILVTGFEPFGTHSANPSEELAKAIDGRQVAAHVVRGVTLPVHHVNASRRMAELLTELTPAAVVHLGLAAGRARIALERVALNVMDYELTDNVGYRAHGEPCVAGGPGAYFSTLSLGDILTALTGEGIPAYLSNTAGAYLCNQTMYTTLHAISQRGASTRAGLLHLPLLPSMVAASGMDEPSTDFGVMLRAVEVTLGVITQAAPAR